MSARKGRVVVEHIRGRSVPEARTVLKFTQRAAAREIEKVLASAVANAEANHGLSGDDLFVYTAAVDEGPTLKRWRARARGRTSRINKRTCHVTITLTPVAVPVAAPSKQKKAETPAEVTTAEATTTEEKPKRAAKPKADAKTPAKPRTSRRKKSEES